MNHKVNFKPQRERKENFCWGQVKFFHLVVWYIKITAAFKSYLSHKLEISLREERS